MRRNMTSRLLSASWLVCASACAYDWTIGEPGGGGQSAGGEGGSVTAGTGTGATTTVTGDLCDDLRADLAAKKKAAKVCPSQGQLCDDLAGEDECGCAVSAVWDLSSPETSAYLEAAAALEQAGCAPACGPCGGGTPFCSPLSGELLCAP